MTTSEPTNVGALAAEFQARVECLTERKVPSIRPIRRDISRSVAKSPPEIVLDLAMRLIERGFRGWAYEIVHYHRPTLHSLDAASLERLGDGLDSWSSVDTFGSNLSGQAWREGQVPDSLIHRWARSADRWWRRAALVSTVPLNTKARGGKGDVPRTLAVCCLLIADRDDMVVKAMSWALRELVPYDPQAVQDFLSEHDTTLAARDKREVNNKLSTGLKNPRS